MKEQIMDTAEVGIEPMDFLQPVAQVGFELMMARLECFIQHFNEQQALTKAVAGSKIYH